MSLVKWVTVRDAISATLETISQISIVHDFPRLAPDKQPSKWITWMRDRSRINAWTVSRESTSAEYLTCHEVQITTNVLLVGLLQHNDESSTQDEFDEIIDLVLEAFYHNYRLSLPELVDIQGPATLRVEELRLVSDTTIHYCEIHLAVIQTVHI